MTRLAVRMLQVVNAVSLVLFLLCCLHSIHSRAEPSTGAVTVVQDTDNGGTTVEEMGDSREEVDTEGSNQGEPVEKFIPTHEWQTVKEGQSIPPGLHVQMSMKTGLKQAKLMEGDSGEKYRTIDDDKTLELIKTDKKQVSLEELKRALKDFKTTDLDETDLQREEEVKGKFRSYKELRQDFQDINMDIETDAEIITRLVDILRGASGSGDREDQLVILRDLEYYLHQFDNAVLFKDLSGLPLLLKAVNTSKDPELQIEAALVLGTAASLNPQVQVGVLEAGGLQILLPILSTSPSVDVQRKALFALSALCRHFPFAQGRFVELGGLSVVQKLVREGGSDKLKIKALMFLADLMAEQVEVETNTDPEKTAEVEKLKQYQQLSLTSTMVRQGWCPLVPSLLAVPDHESRETVLLAMRLLGASCRQDFLAAAVTLRDLQTEYTSLAQAEREEGDSDEYFSGLLSQVDELLKTFMTKDEL